MSTAFTAFLIALSAILPACEAEDSTNCYWDASVQGNGSGTSFVDVDGTAYPLR